MVGAVCLSESIQKFLFPAEADGGRFEKIGRSNPEFLGPFSGGVEIVCGTLALLGRLTRLAVLPWMALMTVALVTTRVPSCSNPTAGPWLTPPARSLP